MDFPRQAQVSLNGMITTDTVHARTHSGAAFFCVYPNSLGNGETEYWYFQASSTIPTHMREVLTSGTGAPLEVTLYEDAVVSSVGQVMSGYCLNRNSSNIPSLAISRAPVITTTGTRLDNLLIPGAKQDGAMQDIAKTEWVLGFGKKYLLAFSNISGGAIKLNPSAFWYEVF